MRLARLLGAGMPWAALIGACLSLSACDSGGLPSLPSSVTGLFDKPEEKLPGRRVSVLKAGEKALGAEAPLPVALPPAYINSGWTQAGGVPTNAPGHLVAGSATQKLWSTSAGEGSSKRARITAIPVVYEGKVFTLDAEGRLRAHSASNGSRLWEQNLLPDDAKPSLGQTLNPFISTNTARAGYGGGIAADGGRLFVASGFGTVAAFEPQTGKVIWTKKTGVPVRQPPTAAGGRLFFVDSESQAYCLDAADGKELWVAKGLPENASLLSNASPAVAGNLVIIPYPSGELAALDIRTGDTKWTDTLRSTEVGVSAAAIGEAATPVADRDAVFAMNRNGELVATSKDRGQRLWTRELSSSQMPWIAGDVLFAVDSTGKLAALGRKDGKIRWITSLPEAGLWTGPVLASGKLWLVSSKGQLVSVDAVSGAISTQVDLGDPVTIRPVVAEGKLFVLTDKANLIAMN